MVCNFCSASMANTFVKQYYFILKNRPEDLHKFYKEPSLLSWPGIDGVLGLVTTLHEINDKIMSSDYKYCHVEIKTVDSQITVDKGVIIAISGCLARNDFVKNNFSQTIFLAKQEKGFYILNDILRFFDVREATINIASNSDFENDQPDDSPTQNQGPWNIDDNQISSNTEPVVENEKIEKGTMDHPVREDTLVNDVVSTTFIGSCERVVAPAKVSNDTLKSSYASVLAKTTSPKAATYTLNIHKQILASPVDKESVSLGIGSPKASICGGSVSKTFTSSNKITPKSSTSGQRALNASPHAEVKGIYIGGLPVNITKQGLVDVVNKFGPVRENTDNVQIMRHEDGFCCGFVEFESVDAAQRAVEAHHVMFGKTEAYITYKRSSYNRGNNGGVKSPTKGGNRNDNVK